MGKKTKLQKYIEKEEGEIEDLQKQLDFRKESLSTMKKVENGDSE